jgi:biopolymer transport protein ExbD
MALRKKKKHVAEVNMSSMTDIIFMLLIFFMLTSTMVKFIQYKLPESNQRTTSSIKTIVGIEKSGKFTVNYKTVDYARLEASIRAAMGQVPEGVTPTVTIAAEVGTPFEQVTKVMAVANRIKARTILATDPNE